MTQIFVKYILHLCIFRHSYTSISGFWHAPRPGSQRVKYCSICPLAHSTMRISFTGYNWTRSPSSLNPVSVIEETVLPVSSSVGNKMLFTKIGDLLTSPKSSGVAAASVSLVSTSTVLSLGGLFSPSAVRPSTAGLRSLKASDLYFLCFHHGILHGHLWDHRETVGNLEGSVLAMQVLCEDILAENDFHGLNSNMRYGVHLCLYCELL